MVETRTNCDNCIHKNICSIKDGVKQVKNTIMTEYSSVNKNISIEVNCKEYKMEYTGIR